jgi:hypothetical protein
VFENTVLRRIFGPKREHVRAAGEHFEMKLQICTAHKIFYDNQTKGDEMGEAYSCTRHIRNTYTILIGNPEGKRQRGRPSVDDRIMNILNK